MREKVRASKGLFIALCVASSIVIAGCASSETAGELVLETSASDIDPTESNPTESNPIESNEAATDVLEVDPELIALAGLEPCPDGVSAPDAAVPGLPTLVLNCLDGGGPIDLSELRGSPMVVNVWASWCPPCIAEMPLLARASNDLSGQVQFLGINLQDDRTAALQLLTDMRVTFPSVEDRAGETRAPLTVPGPPVTFFVRPDGVIAGRWDGQIQSEEQFASMLQEYLGITW